MPTAEARVTTPRADRYLTQLTEHLGQMKHGLAQRTQGRGSHPGERGVPPSVKSVDRAGDHARIVFDWGTCSLFAPPNELVVQLQAADAQALARGRDLIQRRLETIGRRDGLTVAWKPEVQD